MQKIPKGLATLATVLGLTALVATAAQGQIYCGGTWTAACASGTVTAESGHIRFVFTNVPDALGLGGGDASNSVITDIYIRFTDQAGNALVDADGNYYDPVLNSFEGVGGDSDWVISRRPPGNKPFFTQGSYDWSIGLASVATNKLCGGLVAESYDPDALPNKCNDDFHTKLVFEIDFSGTPTPVAEIRTDWRAQVQNICAEGETECEYSDWAAVPEPITTVLVGSGLLGLGGAAWLRRRRRHIGDV